MTEQPLNTHATPVTLETCDVEPIHIPGQVESHGALLAFDLDGKLVAWRANTATLLGLTSRLGTRFVSHQGNISYRYEEPHVVFAVELPLRPDSPS